MRNRLRDAATAGLARTVLAIVAVLFLGYLVVLTFAPNVREGMPAGFRWFGQPNSAVTIAIVTAVLFALGLLLYRANGTKRSGAPVAIVGALALMSLVLGVASYWDCHDDNHPRFFTTVMWTAGLVKGGITDQLLDGGACPSPTPVALEIARLSGLAAVFLGIFGVATAVFQSRVDRLRVYLARRVTAVIGIDDDAEPMIAAIAHTLAGRSTLVVVTDSPDRPCVSKARTRGARIVTIDFGNTKALAALSIWRKLDRLYLLAPDPSTNLLRLSDIAQRVPESRDRDRIPLIVRIDDPWQAGAWRAQHFGGKDARWAADAVGRYEVTARRLLDEVTADPTVRRILVCGSSELTLALCADMTQRQLEHDYSAAHDDPALATITVIAPDAEAFGQDDEFSRRRLGLPADLTAPELVSEVPSIPQLLSLIERDPTAVAVVLVDNSQGLDVSFGTRLAARTPTTPIFAWDPNALVTENRIALVGRLRTYRLSMDLPEGQAQDAWERAARLIHQRYTGTVTEATPATLPWDGLSEFYRGSNRRQVSSALRIVEQIGGHTWNTFGSSDTPAPMARLRGMAPADRLAAMGFDRGTAIAMAAAEHDDWRGYYLRNGWTQGSPRDDAAKVHDGLVDWTVIEANDDSLDKSLTSLAATLSTLRELGYRSRRADAPTGWQSFRRGGTVLAEQRHEPWTWTTDTGHTMHAAAGDWSVVDERGGSAWSVRDDIFRGQHEHLSGRRWQRLGTVLARPARGDETISTLEGPVVASEGDWVVQGDRGEQWPVSASAFAQRYQR